MNYDIPPYLRRRRSKSALGALLLVILGFCLMGVAMFVLMMDFGAQNAHAEERYMPVLKDGHLLTPSQFCGRQP